MGKEAAGDRGEEAAGEGQQQEQGSGHGDQEKKGEKKKRRPKCPVCRQEVDLRPQNPSFPFCSSRCRMVDLGRWLNEEYRMPISQAGTERSLPKPRGPEDDEF